MNVHPLIFTFGHESIRTLSSSGSSAGCCATVLLFSFLLCRCSFGFGGLGMQAFYLNRQSNEMAQVQKTPNCEFATKAGVSTFS